MLVLSTKQTTTLEKKGKNAEIEKWEAELRTSLAIKKAAASQTLTKQDRALVDAQLKKESEVRRQVYLVQANLRRGLALIRSVVEAGVEEFRSHIALVVGLLLDNAVGNGSSLAGEEVFETYLVRMIFTSCLPYLTYTSRRISGNAAPND